MTDFVYTDSFDTEGTSSAIDEVFYDAVNQRLVIGLARGVFCGYEGVDAAHFTALKLINEARIGGNEAASVGRYWNEWIKNNFTGFSTEALNIVPVDTADAELSVEEQDALEAIVTDEPVEDQSEPVEKSAYGVKFDDGDVIDVFATSEADAIKIVGKIADLAGWDTPAIESVTHYL